MINKPSQAQVNVPMEADGAIGTCKSVQHAQKMLTEPPTELGETGRPQNCIRVGLEELMQPQFLTGSFIPQLHILVFLSPPRTSGDPRSCGWICWAGHDHVRAVCSVAPPRAKRFERRLHDSRYSLHAKVWRDFFSSFLFNLFLRICHFHF